MSYKQVILHKNKEKSLSRKHPWVFSGAIYAITDGEPSEGEIVKVYDYQKNFLAIGYYNQNTTISIKVLSFENTIIDTNFWKSKINNAIQLRKDLNYWDNEETTCFRLIHAEGDSCPGLIIDIYNETAVVLCYTIGIYHMAQIISDCIVSESEGKIKNVYLKNIGLNKIQDGTFENKYLHLGEDEKNIHFVAKENNNLFKADWIKGQKSGFFIDQRDNRELLAKYVSGKKVLNTFCYSGGFSIYALNNNASLVHSLDSSQKAIDLVEENLVLNQLDKSKHLSIVDDAMDYIKNLETDYDVIVLDPPAFAKSRKTSHKAVQGYKRLNSATIKQIKKGGIIFTFSCSQAVGKQLFRDTITAAAIEANRDIQILHQLNQPSDHPINIYHPEGEYLKGLVIRVN